MSRVRFLLSGELDHTGARTLEDGVRTGFPRGSLRRFIMSTPEPLGHLLHMRIWHDNSGDSTLSCSWYLDKVLVDDVQTGESFVFLCSDWLAYDHGDGKIDRYFLAASTKDVTEFNNLFFTKAKDDMSENHLWVSVVSRPKRSSFTRVQRVTCVLCLLLSTMLANMMFYRSDSEQQDRDTAIQIGPFILSTNTFLISIFGSIVVVPINFLILTVFRKTSPGHFSKEELQKQAKNKKFWKRSFWFPPWVRYIAWVIAIIEMSIASVFILFYSLEWGQTKSLEWLTSFFLSTIESICCIQPFEVILTAIIIAFFLKSINWGDNSENPDPNLAGEIAKIKEQSAVLDPVTRESVIEPKYAPLPPEKSILQEQLDKIEFEKKMSKVTWSVVSHFAVLLLVNCMAWGIVNNSYVFMNEATRNLLDWDPEQYDQEVTQKIPLSDVSDYGSFIQYLENTVAVNMFNDRDFLGQISTNKDKQFIWDGVTLRAGALRLRQLRITPENCKIEPVMRTAIRRCNPMYSSSQADDKNYDFYWEPYNPTVVHSADEAVYAEFFKYRSTKELFGVPLSGDIYTYAGDGYVAEMGVTSYRTLKRIKAIKDYKWIDNRTRAVFLELALYNPNVNLFSYVVATFEFAETGGIFPRFDVTSFSIYADTSGRGIAVLAAQVIYYIIIFVLVVKHLLKIAKDRLDYFKEFWNWIDLALIVASGICLGIFMSREFLGRDIMKQLKDNKEGYTSFAIMSTYQKTLFNIFGVITFLVNIKTCKVLALNHHVQHFVLTLKKASGTLLSYTAIFIIWFLGFGAWGIQVFGDSVLEFRSLLISIQTQFSMLLGKFDLAEMPQHSLHMARMYYFAFGWVMFLTMVNMFLGILGEAMVEAQEDLGEEVTEHKALDFFKEKLLSVVGMTTLSEKKDVREKYIYGCEDLLLRLNVVEKMAADYSGHSVDNPDDFFMI